jgi:putative OPT family oligopeptide transporter
MSNDFKPYVPVETDMKEFTFKAVFLGLIMAVVLGAANSYLGLRVGMTVAATFPAAVVAMAALRIFKGSVLEENIARTIASVGEALVAGAIFTIPAFVMAGVWDEIRYFESSILMLVGGILGVLFVTVSRRALISETELPFPESVACSEIIKAGQTGGTGAKFVFSAMGLSALIQLFKSSSGLQLFSESFSKAFQMGKAHITTGLEVGKDLVYKSAIYLHTPAASPAILGVGYIVGPRLGALAFAGGVFAWFFLVPLALLFNTDLTAAVDAAQLDWLTVGVKVWKSMIRPLAVGAMVVGSFYTLFKLRKPLTTGIGRAFKDMKASAGSAEASSRIDKDIKISYIIGGIVILIIPLIFLYNYYTKNLGGALLAALVMAVAGFLFAAIAGYLVGLIGSSNNPISGLTLSTLLIAAILMVSIGLTGDPGIAAVLGVAAVVCCVAGIGGDMIQDLKVGHILGGTPWKMELGELIGVAVTAFVLAIPIALLHNNTPGGIGGAELPAPQAGLMALMAKGIVGGEMAWSLIIIGMFFAVALILLNTPSVMIIAVGMYLPFNITCTIFLGGIVKWVLQKIIEKKKVDEAGKQVVENAGVLLASGMVAGESLMGILLALFIATGLKIPTISDNPLGGILVFAILAFVLLYYPVKSLRNAKSS